MEIRYSLQLFASISLRKSITFSRKYTLFREKLVSLQICYFRKRYMLLVKYRIMEKYLFYSKA